MPGNKRYFFLGLIVIALVLAADQWSKYVMLALIPTPDSPAIEVAPFFNLALVWNYGISFGMFAAHRQPVVLTVLSVAIVAILLIWLYKNHSRLAAYALGCVIGGATGNILDRLRFGAVTDFLDFHLGVYHWPAFNIADSSIFIGVVLLCASSMFSAPHQHTEGSSS